jgi:hypothetical protein
VSHESDLKHKCEKTPAPTSYPTSAPTTYPTPYPTSAPTDQPTTYPTPSPTAYPTPSPTPYPTPYPSPSPTDAPVAACPIPCMQHCINKYGGGNLNQNFDSGQDWDGSDDAYYCAKGCATMGSGKIGTHKYCSYSSSFWESNKDWSSSCKDKCDNSSASDDNKDICRYGCNFWSDSCLNGSCGAES